jgi:hypothetical protein
VYWIHLFYYFFGVKIVQTSAQIYCSVDGNVYSKLLHNFRCSMMLPKERNQQSQFLLLESSIIDGQHWWNTRITGIWQLLQLLYSPPDAGRQFAPAKSFFITTFCGTEQKLFHFIKCLFFIYHIKWILHWYSVTTLLSYFLPQLHPIFASIKFHLINFIQSVSSIVFY